MRRRLTVLVAVAFTMVLMTALSGAALAQPVGDAADRQCMQLAAQTYGFDPGLNPGNTNFVGGTEGTDNFTGQATYGSDVFCGFGGDDYIQTLDEEDIFLGGEGDDEVTNKNYGTFYGGKGNDRVHYNYGTFYGDEDSDSVYANYGTFYGGGSDTVYANYGTFYGGEGPDFVYQQILGIFVQ